MRINLVLLFRVAILMLAGSANSALADDYSILTGDRILLRAGWWDHANLQYRDWVGVSGEYAVDPQGKINVPLAGSVSVGGISVEELSAKLSQQIQRRIGLTALPEVAVEIVGHTPIYVSGSVTSPGEYPFRRGMIVMQAASLAGGIGGGDGTLVDSAERDTMRFGGNMRVLSLRVSALEAERGRLIDEIATLESQSSNVSEQPGKSSTGLEKEIFEARQRSIDTRSRNIQELQEVVSEQLARIEDQVELREKQLETAREDAKAMALLKERGLAVRSRETALLTNVANMEAQLIQLDVARLEAVQQLNFAHRDEITLYDEARLGRLARLKEVNLELATTRAEEETALALYADAVARSNVPSEELNEIITHYVVTRALDPGIGRITASPSTPLEPGDTLEILLELIEPRLAN